MEVKKEITPEEREKCLELDLKNAELTVRESYSTLLLDEQLIREKERNRRPPEPIPLEMRERFFEIAKHTKDSDKARMALKMERDWGNASRGGRPPIGGALDD